MPLKLNLGLFYCFIFLFTSSFAQEKQFSVASIPIELKENANAVVRQDAMEVNVKSPAEMHIKVNRIVTVLNKVGDANVGAVVGYDDNSRITELTAKIYDAFGTEIKKISKGKFIDVSAVDGGTLYSDSRVKYLDFTPTSYPYTIQLEYEIRTSSTGFLPNWQPIEAYFVSVENSSYTLHLNEALKARIKEIRLDGYAIDKAITDNMINYEVKNIQALKSEELSPSLVHLTPKVLLALNDFRTDGVKGYYTNWNEFGRWMNDKLLQGRDQIDGVTKQKIIELVAKVDSDLEKAKLVYKFMQEKTRYISVQVGIGGIQPIPASEVDMVGYGDCKGLTNYTKALLDIAGVTSYYTHIEANSSDPISFESDFASLEQGNHVILNIPNGGNDIWLECTSQTIPFGFLGDFTDDRDALVITPEGGVIKHTSSYKNEQNLQKTTAKIQLDSLGSLRAELTISSEGIQFDRKYFIETYSNKEVFNYYKTQSWNYINNLTIHKVELENDKDSVILKEQINLNISDFASIVSEKMLFRVNVFNKSNYIPKRYRNRTMPLQISRGYKDEDSYEIEIPKGYELGNIFEEKTLETKFGSYQIKLQKINEKTLLYTRVLLIKAGDFPKEAYDEYRDFRKEISKYDNLRIAINKQ